jgi:methylated-DNA-protein-cysteine methyltransferase related protein
MDRAAREARIIAVIRDIPRGRVASYGQVAGIAGIPRGARQVGYVLRNLPDGHDVPWQRVIRSGGTLAFARGTPQYARQCQRLLSEGVAVIGGRIDMERFGWQPDLDELLWKPSASWDDR